MCFGTDLPTQQDLNLTDNLLNVRFLKPTFIIIDIYHLGEAPTSISLLKSSGLLMEAMQPIIPDIEWPTKTTDCSTRKGPVKDKNAVVLSQMGQYFVPDRLLRGLVLTPPCLEENEEEEQTKQERTGVVGELKTELYLVLFAVGEDTII
ncbi:hypothetical protein CFP56_015065 [Quercus suber]|uniref:Uncharacterized protein n=1 Tax=Quercus suber TaxID=58331 RepID=A0AAW0KQP3_QUESU